MSPLFKDQDTTESISEQAFNTQLANSKKAEVATKLNCMDIN